MNPNHEDRATSFFAQPGILAGKSHILSYVNTYIKIEFNINYITYLL